MNYMPNSLHARDVASVVHPQTNLRLHEEVGPLLVERGQGIRITDEGGREYLEGAAGLWCASLGFASERLARVAYEQMRQLGYYHIYRHVSNQPSIELAETLIRLAPIPVSKVLFQCSGSEANDAAIKLVWYYWHAQGRPEKHKIIGRRMGYHGSTCASVSVSGKPDMHMDFGLPLPGFVHTETPNYYRFHEDGESEEDYATRLAEALDQVIVAEGPETVGAFFAEPVMGAGGGLVPPRTYFEKIQAVLRKHDVLFVADEVICGFGRTGNWWGSQTFDLQPDMISCAKALSAGMQPISALLIGPRVWDGMLAESDKLGNFAHGATYAGHPVAAAVALEVLRIYEEENLIEHAARVGDILGRAMRGLADHPLVGDVRGVGLLWGLEMVRDPAKREFLPAAAKAGTRIERNARKHGLVTRVIGDRVVFSPALILTDDDAVELVRRLKLALDDTHAELAAEGLTPAA